MLLIKPAVYPLSAAAAAHRDARKIEATRQGTALRDAITLEREKNPQRDNSRKDSQQHEAEDTEHNLHLYTAMGSEMELVGANREVDITA